MDSAFIRNTPVLTRRRLLAGAAAFAAGVALDIPGHADQVPPISGNGIRVLRARAGTVELRGAGGPATPVWCYDGAVPGPLIRVKRGEEFRLRLINELPEPTAIHWHGVRLVNPMDGAPMLTQPAIAPGADFDYRFSVPDAGTFWYHGPPNGSSLAHSLHGVLIVEEPTPVDVDRDVTLVLDEVLLDGSGAAEKEASAAPAGGSEPSRQLAVNGQPRLDIPVKVNERLRLRLLNATTARILSLRVDQHRAMIMAIDGEPAEPFEAGGGRVALGPGNRLDLFIDATLGRGHTAALVVEQPGVDIALGRLVYDSGVPARPAPRPDPQPLPANPLPARMAFERAFRLDVPLEPPAGGPQSPWTAAEPASVPLFSVKRSRTVMLALANRGQAAHSVHVHGHHFRLLDNLDDGWKPYWLDTITVMPGQIARIAFVADNPGRWLIERRRLDGPALTVAAWFEVI